jgi:hypothetical protein
MTQSRGTRDGATAAPVPAGLQRLLRLAHAEPAFLATLIECREAAAEAAGVGLTRSERAVLRAAPAGTLALMARTLPPPPAERLPFLRRTAATAVVLLGGAVLADVGAGCGRSPSTPAPDAAGIAVAAESGAAPDAAEAGETETDPADDGGGAAAEDVLTTTDAAGSDGTDGPPGDEADAAPDAGAADAGDAADAAEGERDATLGSAFGLVGDARPDVVHTVRCGGAAPDMPPRLGDAEGFSLRIANTVADGALPEEVARRILTTNRARLRACGEPLAAEGLAPRGRLRIRLEVEAAGRVASATLLDDGTGSRALAQCVTAAVGRLRFPEGGSATRIEFDLLFQPE